MTGLPFIKMHGLGNDFVVLDARQSALALSADQIRGITDRRVGVGCDQLIVVEPPADALADAFMRIYNADGGEAGACGNGTRCVAAMVMEEKEATQAIIETAAGLLDATLLADGRVSVDMGRAMLDWQDIPLAKPIDTLHLGIGSGPLEDPVAVGMGNPHAVFFVDDADAVPLEVAGPAIETHHLFPEYTNVGVAQVLSGRKIRLRVWERGVGITQACGSGACAAVVAAHRRGLTERAAEVFLDGGTLGIEWLPDDHVLMTGAVAVSFIGTLNRGFLS